MSQVRLYVDEDATSHAVIKGLRQLGVDVLTADEAGELCQPDDRHLRRDCRKPCNLHAEYRGFRAASQRLSYANGKSHAGIVTIPAQRYSIGEKIRRIAEFVQSTTAEEMTDRIEFL